MSDDDDLSDDVAAILAQFPKPAMFRPSKLKSIVGCIVFTLMIGLFARLTWGAADRGDLLYVIVHGSGALFCVFADVVAIVVVATDTSFMRLDTDGFEIQYAWRYKRSAWRDVDRFTVRSMSKGGIVAFDDANASGFSTGFNRLMFGRSTFLGDTYGLTQGDMARLLTEWRKRALAFGR